MNILAWKIAFCVMALAASIVWRFAVRMQQRCYLAEDERDRLQARIDVAAKRLKKRNTSSA